MSLSYTHAASTFQRHGSAFVGQVGACRDDLVRYDSILLKSLQAARAEADTGGLRCAKSDAGRRSRRARPGYAQPSRRAAPAGASHRPSAPSAS